MASTYTGLSAAGTTQGAATALGAGLGYGLTYYEVIVATSGSATGVRLPTAAAGQLAAVGNFSGISISIFPQVGGTVAGGATNAATTLATGTVAYFRTQDLGVTWASVTAGQAFATGGVSSIKIAGATTLAATQSGAVIGLGAGGAFAVTLPTPVPGMLYTFIATATPGGTVGIGLAAAANITGFAMGGATPVVITGQSFVNYTTTARTGDKVTLSCIDAGVWLCQAAGGAAGAFTVTA